MDRRVAKNTIWVLTCRIVQAVLALIITMLTARFLGPANYGIINYAASITAFLLPFAYIGLNSILVQLILEHKDREETVLGTAITLSCASSVVCILFVWGLTSVLNFGETETVVTCVLYSIMLLGQSLELIQYWYQSKLLAKYTAVVTIVSYVIVSAYKIALLVLEMGIYWFAVSTALDYILIGVILLILYRKKFASRSFGFSFAIAKEIFGKGKYYILSNLMIVVFGQTDRIMIKLMIDETAVGYYSTGVTIVGLTSFVFIAIIDSFRPVILEDKKRGDTVSYEKDIKQLYSIVIWLSVLQTVFMIILASPLVSILYGKEYMPSVPVLRIIALYSVFTFIGPVRDIWLLAEDKYRYLSVINTVGAVGNVLLNLVLIPLMGIQGAAVASLTTQILANVVVTGAIKSTRQSNLLLLQSIPPRNLELGKLIKIIKNKIKKD